MTVFLPSGECCEDIAVSSLRPVLVLHGFLAPAASNLPIHLALRSRGRRTYDAPIPGLNTQDIARSSELVSRRVDEILAETGAPSIDLVGVSMGGLIAVHYVRCRGGRSKVRRTITLGSPLVGTDSAPVVRLLQNLPVVAATQMARASEIVRAIAEAHDDGDDIVSVYADGDTVVSREAASLPGAIVRKAPVGNFPIGHYQLVVDPRNLAFLADHLDAA